MSLVKSLTSLQKTEIAEEASQKISLLSKINAQNLFFFFFFLLEPRSMAEPGKDHFNFISLKAMIFTE